MTTGALIYLVSACTSGEEFVAAFRRYADRNGLFIPIAVPIPAGRRGRFAVTLKDGGVMIEGDADIVSSATTPSVLHGRVGMTLRFIEPDIKSKTVLIELEQARLAMKPQPPSVPPRPAQIPMEPRPKVPTLAGRIDANNALAECVAIGDVDALEATVPQVQKAGPKFVVPTIPPVAGARPKAPTTPPMGYALAEKKPAIAAPPTRPQTPSTPPPLAGLPPSIPPKPARASAPAPAITPMSITTIDAPIVTPSPSITPMSITTVDAPIVTPTGMAVAKPSVTQGWDASDVEDTGDESEEVEPPRDTIAMPAVDPGEAVAALARSRTASDELTAVPQAREADVFQIARPRGNDSDTFPVVQVPSLAKDAIPEALPDSKSNGNSARMGLPPPRRTSGNTQPPPVRHPTPSAPLPVVGRTSTKQGVSPPRGATQLGLPIVQLKTPAKPSEVPRPPVVAEEQPKPPPELSDEPTDITGVPIVGDITDSAALVASAPVVEPIPPSPSRPIPGTMRKTVMGIAVVPAGVTVLPASPSSPIAKPTEEAIDAPEPPPNIEVNFDAMEPAPAKVEPKLPGQRPPVIEEPSGDWTMIPGEAGPTILPRKPEPPAGDNKLPTGDWTIARVEDSPDGWSEPSKVEERAPIARTIPTRANTGPPVAMVAGEKPLEVTMTAKAFDIEEETKSGLKVEVDSSLAVERSSSSVDVSLASTQYAVPQSPLMTPPPGTLSPVVMAPPMTAGSMSAHGMTPMARVPSQGSGSFPDFQGPTRGSQPADLFGTSALSESTSMLDRGRKKRIIIIAASAGAAIVIGVVLLIAFGLGDPKKVEAGAGSSARVVDPPAADAGVTDLVVKDPIVVDAGTPVVEPDAAQTAITPPDNSSDECFVDVSSSPSGAEILRGREVVGTTPAKLAMPCGVEAKLVVRKSRFASSSRTVTPTAAGAKLRVTLGKTLLSVKVTSSPPGASITLGGKSLGVTPAVVKLPAMESATLVIGKTGFNSDSQKITPKQNNQSVHVTLKKKPR